MSSVLQRTATGVVAVCLAIGSLLTAALPAAAAPRVSSSVSTGNCDLPSPTGAVKHVIEIQFDNVHFTRDNPNVPSDLEQMPHLLNFMEQNGVLLTNHHTPLIAHTATDILTTLTGVYGNNMGVPIANTYRYFNPNGTSNPAVSFAYWTDPIYDYSTSTPTDTTYNMLTATGKNAPAPWVPFTRAGCNVGMVATANTVLENIATDIPTVFGSTSSQAAEVTADPAQATADFVGIGIHCAASDALCSTANGGVTDALPDEPGGYTGHQALFGAKYVDPQVFSGGTPVDLGGNTIESPTGQVGFPGFDGMSASVSLSWVAAMQEHGVPVTYAYISDAHDSHQTGPAYGPGQAGYVAALKSYDDAFASFFTRLQADGITPANTEFVITSDENDHYVGGAGTPAGCDGINVPCTYSHVNCPSATITSCPSNNVGEINVNMAGLLATQQGITTPFTVHSDSAPNVYITGNPSRTDPAVRAFEQATSKLTLTNPLTGATQTVTNALADPVEEQILHMITADPMRTPTFTLFANPDDYLYAAGKTCATTYLCVQQEYGFAWNHGDVSPDINTTWLGLVGPGVQQLGVDNGVWSDHTDVRPTLMALTGLTDDYAHDGRVLWEVLTGNVLPMSSRIHRGSLVRLAQAYKQLDAAVGDFGLATLAVSTDALASQSTSDATYTDLENWLANIGGRRDKLAGQISGLLEGAAFGGQAVNAQQAKNLTAQAWALIQEAQAKAAQ
jgi:hypothetical protein